MTYTLEWPQIIDKQIVEAILSGTLKGRLENKLPDKHIETGLAHLFFFDDEVFKLYKTHHEPEHFIKAVLAPTKRRVQFTQHDFSTNRHFSQGIYREIFSIKNDKEGLRLASFDESSIHSLILMDRLDFANNLHERLLRKDVTENEMYNLGQEKARLMLNHTVVIPDTISWYSQAIGRMRFLKQFIEWLPETYQANQDINNALLALDTHLEKNKDEYELIVGANLCADLDNHDENIFIDKGTVRVIDAVPPMDCWWYGVPESNLTALMVNVEVLHSSEMAEHIKRGYDDFHGTETVRKNIFEFTRAFNYLISIAHFGSLEDKQDVAKKYVAGCVDIPARL